MKNYQTKRKISTIPPRVDWQILPHFQKSLKTVCKEKTTEIDFEMAKLEKEHDIEIPNLTKKVKTVKEFSADWLRIVITEYAFQSRLFKLELWKKYWQRLLPNYKPKKVSGLSDQDIQKARDFPIHDLIDGNFRNSNGRSFCCCPFHKEKTPSFCVYPNNSWHCFGCGVHGNNAVDFLMQAKDLDFKEAVEELL